MKVHGPSGDPAFEWDPVLEAYVRRDSREIARLAPSPDDCKRNPVTKLCAQGELFETFRPAELDP